MARELLGEWSDRTFATYWSAITACWQMGWDPQLYVARHTRRNGSVNVSALHEDVMGRVAVLTVRRRP